ncbi:MAG TPA: hypothetical protein VK541_12450 [Pedobacter sp.]|uniref:hypothetical protein n=1 Tax=Pedobacter sp. TaxID=1411316 RepID=UPI002CBD820B|nr:hypothetical protein [Pedobacter sp.]HMI03291.1 hypothetical protein [Pedobacter sp.]
MKLKIFLTCVLTPMACFCLAQSAPKEKTAFQTGSAWRPEIDVRSDIAIVYGAGDRKGMTFEQRVQSWRDHGYQTHFMTGIAWGEYQDYFLGKWDGKNHQEIGQMERDGKVIWHGGGVPYIVPVQSFLEYMKTAIIKKVIDAGISSIYLEEPEFWARAGYSEVFKKEWKSFYGFDWRPQHESAENTYLSHKLKYQLYYNAIKEVSAYAKSYGKEKGMDIKVYIATHSLVNYSSWRIVSPEASLASLPGIDGYIAQVWTGTSREPTYYDGQKKERVFENAFLEYGSMVSMTAPTGRKMFFLTDPIEDWPRDWADYKKNYQATFTAKLLYPVVNNYEVMPWPERIYTRPYKLAGSNEEVLIPKYYSTQMQVMVNALNNMPLSENRVTGVNGIGVLMGNSLMFQQFPVHKGYNDPAFSNFYGQTLPLLKNGVPVQTVHMENLSFKNTLKEIKVLVVSYSNMKPFAAEVNQHLADWVKGGGVLVYCGSDDDPYQSVLEWWNTKGNSYKVPSEHLFGLMNIKAEAHKKLTFGRGTVYVIRQDPKDFVLKADSDQEYIQTVKHAYEVDARAGKLLFKNNLYLPRGAYDIVSVLDEHADAKPFVIKGPVVDLFDSGLPVLAQKVIHPGEQGFLYNITRIKDKSKPMVLASASRISEEVNAKQAYSFICKSPANTVNSMRILLPAEPKSIAVTGHAGGKVTDVKTSWDAGSKTYYMGFDNSPDGIKVSLSW